MAEKTLIITGSRAEWGLLKPLAFRLLARQSTRLIITGSHLSGQLDSNNINFPFYENIEILTDSDNPNGICSTMGLAMIKFGEAFNRIKPTKLVVLGDRYEILAAVIVAYNMGIPVYHIEGGDVSLGSLDDGYRRCITELASVHLVATDDAAARINKPNTFVVGSLGCFIPIEAESKGKIDNMVAVFHAHKGDFKSEFDAIMEFLHGKNVTWFGAGLDSGGRWINKRIPKIISLTRENYLALLRSSVYIIGNSSSGIIEAPTLNIPTINVGQRQMGRIRAKSVIDCEGTVGSIRDLSIKSRI